MIVKMRNKCDWLPIGRPFVIGVMNPPTFTVTEYANLKIAVFASKTAAN